MRVEEVESDGWMVVFVSKNFNVEVANTRNVGRARLRDGVGESLGQFHKFFAGKRTFVVVVAVDGGEGDFAADTNFSKFEDGLFEKSI